MAIKKSIYLSDENLEKLDKIVAEFGLFTKDNEPNYTKAIVHMINHFPLDNDEDKRAVQDELSSIRKMVEQINLSIPHLMYNTTFSYKINEGTLSDQKFTEFKNYTLENVSKICGQIQQQNYDHVYVSTDAKNMKTLPVEAGENTWK